MDADELRAKHGQIIRAEIGGAELVFFPMSVAYATELSERLNRAPEIALEMALAACREHCGIGVEQFDEVAEWAPLAFSAETGVCGQLLELASIALAESVKTAIRKWRSSGRQLGAVAEALLAFKAHTGGPASADALAGALHIAEHFDTQKALYRLHLSFMRGLSRK